MIYRIEKPEGGIPREYIHSYLSEMGIPFEEIDMSHKARAIQKGCFDFESDRIRLSVVSDLISRGYKVYQLMTGGRVDGSWWHIDPREGDYTEVRENFLNAI